MKDSLINVFYFFFVLDFVINAFYFYFLRKLLKLLKENYFEKFKELGEPSLWWNNSPRNTIRVLKFVFSKDPVFSSDINLSKTRNLVRIFLITGIVDFILLFILFWSFFLAGYQEFRGG